MTFLKSARFAWAAAIFFALGLLVTWVGIWWWFNAAGWLAAASSNFQIVDGTLQSGPASSRASRAMVASSPSARDGSSAAAGPALSPSLAAELSQSLQTTRPTRLELFVMSQCPYGVIAESVLLPWISQQGGTVDLHIGFIATASGVDFTSLHGPAEVAEDIRQTIIASHFRSQLPEYLLCRAGNYREENGWRACALKVGLNVDELTNLAAAPDSITEFRQNISRAEALGVTASPTLYVNGQRYANSIFTLGENSNGCQ